MDLRSYLEKEGIVKKFFAKKVGVSHTHLYDLMRYKYAPTLEMAIRIEEATRNEVSVYDWSNNGKYEKKNKKHNDAKDINT